MNLTLGQDVAHLERLDLDEGRLVVIQHLLRVELLARILLALRYFLRLDLADRYQADLAIVGIDEVAVLLLLLLLLLKSSGTR